MDATRVLTIALCVLVAGALGWCVPAVIARVPEPVPQPVPEPVPQPVPEPEPDPEADLEPDSEPDPGADPERQRLFTRELPPAPPKVLYVEIAAARGLGAGTAVLSAVLAGVVGAVLGPTGALLFWVPLIVLGVALAVIDVRVHLLPTWLIRRGYVGLAVLVLVAALVDRDVHALYRAAGGWLVLGGFYYVLFWIGGMGFGDVRLARLVGPALGYLGWAELVLGLFAITLIAGLGGVVAAVAMRSVRGRIPYGPYILVGALVGVVVAPVLLPTYLSGLGP